MSAVAALTRASCLAASMGCAAPQDSVMALTSAERIVGRAALPGRVVMLTNEPALVTIRAGSNQIARVPVRPRSGPNPKLWGLGEIDHHLYSISGFSDLVRLAPGEAAAGVQHVARLSPPVSNLVDSAAGMAAQLALEDRGKPIAWTMDTSGRLSAIQGSVRAALGLSRAEESLLHLLSCSLPPRVLCWLPGSNELLALDGDRLEPLVTLGPVQRIAPPPS